MTHCSGDAELLPNSRISNELGSTDTSVFSWPTLYTNSWGGVCIINFINKLFLFLQLKKKKIYIYIYIY